MRDLRIEKGLTLVELLIAASVLAVGLLGVAGTFPSAYQNVKYGGRITRATALAQEMVELLRNDSFPALARYNDVNTHSCSSESDLVAMICRRWRDDINAGVRLPSGWGSVAVCIASCTSTTDLAQITVTVRWMEQTGAKMVQLVTYAAQY